MTHRTPDEHPLTTPTDEGAHQPTRQEDESNGPSAVVATSDQTSARDRLRAELTKRPGRGQLIVAVLLAVLGFAAAVQIRLTDTDGDFSGQRRQDLVALLDSLSSATDRAENQIDELEQTRDDLLTSSQRRQAALEEGRGQLEVLGILTGTTAATGPGITITVSAADGGVNAASLLNGVEEMRDAGAEAIEINDTVRVVASTAFTDKDGQVLADGVSLRAPYVIDVIGSPHTLSEAMVFPGGFSDEIEQLGGSADVEEADVVQVASLHKVKPPEYAQPTDR